MNITKDTVSLKVNTIRGVVVIFNRELAELYEEMVGREGK